MKIYHDTPDICNTVCPHMDDETMVYSYWCTTRCAHHIDSNEQWVDCAKETGMKVETAELQFIRDDSGCRNFVAGEDGDFLCEDQHHSTPEEVHDWLVKQGMLTPDPLEKALAALDDNLTIYNNLAENKALARKIIRTLYEEATK